MREGKFGKLTVFPHVLNRIQAHLPDRWPAKDQVARILSGYHVRNGELIW